MGTNEICVGRLANASKNADLRVETERPSAELRGRNLAELRVAALASAAATSTAVERRALVRRPSEAVRVYVRQRAAGKCEGCGQAAPFMTLAKQPYPAPEHSPEKYEGPHGASR